MDNWGRICSIIEMGTISLRRMAATLRRWISPSASVRSRFIVGTGVMMLPLLVLGVGAFLLMERGVDAFNNVAEEAVEELLPIARLQILIHRVSTSIDDYLIRGNPSSRSEFESVAREIDLAFEAAIAGPFALSEERSAIESAMSQWEQAKPLSRNILALSNPVGDPTGATVMISLDSYLRRCVDYLNRVYEAGHREIDDELANAGTLKRIQLYTIAGIFGLGLLAAAVAAILLARSVLKPVALLEEGAKRIGEGVLAYRVKLSTQDEFGRLAASFNDMADKLNVAQAALSELSIRDGLTGLYNGRELHRRLKEQVEHSRRYDRPLSILMLDLDFFKAVNDSYGHQAGDEALQAVAAILRREIRSADTVARYGGEEFIVMLPETKTFGAAAVAERIRAGIANSPILVGQGLSVSITASIGVATFPSEGAGGGSAQGLSEDALIAAADQALYVAKNTGRNRVSPSVFS
ncbi:MAG: diguanylate cyclase [Dehalococcoidia bacterium]|nr:diguanylate cyclase [Dehalococcoidia bacterium]